MNTPAIDGSRFIRKTRLAQNEYRKNFHQIDREIISAITSMEADQITPLMSKIYLRLVNAPDRFWEREGVLRFEEEWREEKRLKAWTVLCETLGVASATANKALSWMHEQGIIGYFSGKNRVGMRIFLNRAVSSIGLRSASSGKKILDFTAASRPAPRASENEAAFNDSFAVSESLDTDSIPLAPKGGADTQTVERTSPEPNASLTQHSQTPKLRGGKGIESTTQVPDSIPLDAIVERLKSELEPCVESAATRAAAQIATREIARTREWFETKALPKAVRVAQRETYDLLRKHGQVEERARRARADLEVGRCASEVTWPKARPLTAEEIQEMAETCVALLEVQGRSIELTLSEIGSEDGGWLLPEDAARVRGAAEKLSLARGERGSES